MASLKPFIEQLMAKVDLTRAEAEMAMRTIVQGVDPCQTAALLVLLQSKGETPSEVAGMVSVMREHMVAVKPSRTCIDIVGTGGDGHHTVNFSTAASIVAAACGACVAKHGNRSVSSQCGSADVLETLGVMIVQQPAGIERCLEEASIAFMFACDHCARTTPCPYIVAAGPSILYLTLFAPCSDPSSDPISTRR